MRFGFQILLASALLCLAGCFFRPNAASEEQRAKKANPNGGIEEIAAQPVPVSGKSAVALYENSRPRCRFTERIGSTHGVRCSVVTVDENGNETLATAIADNLTLRWEEPVLVAGAPVVAQDCAVQNAGLDHLCSITVGEGAASKLKFDLVLSRTALAETRTESSTVLLPYSIETFGRVDFTPLTFATGTTASGGGEAVGFQNTELNPLTTILSTTYSTCAMGGAVYVSTWPFVYEYKNGVLRLFAGSLNPANITEYSHRLRTFLGAPTGGPPYTEGNQLACRGGNLYISVNRQEKILRIDSEGRVHHVAGTGQEGHTGDGGPATAAKISSPTGIAVGPDGSVYFASTGRNVIRKVAPDGIISTVAGTGVYGFSGDGGPATAAEIGYVTGLAVNEAGEIFISDPQAARIRKVSATGTITTVAGNGSMQDPFVEGGVATENPIQPYMLAIDHQGHLIFTEAVLRSNVRRLSNGVLTTIVGGGPSGPLGPVGDGGPALAAKLYGPVGLSADADGAIYIADAYNEIVRKVSPQGIMSTFAGIAEVVRAVSPPPLTGRANEMHLQYMTGVALAPGGTMYVSIMGRHSVLKISASGAVSVFAGDGTQGFAGDNGPAVQAKLFYPQGLAMGSDGSLYIVDQGNHRIRKVDPTGSISTVVGGGTELGDGGPATGAQLFNPSALVIDSAGTLYIADTGNHRIRVVSGGQISTLAGEGTSFGEGVAISSARLASPSGLALDAAGNLFVSEYGQHRVRKISASLPRTIRTIGGQGISGFRELTPPSAGTTGRFSYPSHLTTDFEGRVYVVDRWNNRVRLLQPTADPWIYLLSTFFGGTTDRDCGGGALKGRASGIELNDSLRAGIGAVCVGAPVVVTSRSTCASPADSQEMAIAQNFTGKSGHEYNHVVRITHPCPQN